MQPREYDGSAQADTPAAARARLVSALQHGGRSLSSSVQDAFAQVPRHVFVPEVGAAAAYRDEAFVIKCGDDGQPISSSSQPAMMAIMLDQLGLQQGDRVLEIGTGTGYNAAVMSAVVGPAGQVISVDIDAELVARARSSLTAAGYDAVAVRCADGGYGDPAGTPFDRIIVTAGAWDIAPAWLDQLRPGGRLVLPLSVRGIQLSVALEAEGDAWLSTSAFRCGFVRMLGAFAGPETVLHLPEPYPLFGQMSDGTPVDGAGLQRALAGPWVEAPALRFPVRATDLADLDLWLTLISGLDRLTALAAPGDWFSMAALLPFGALVSDAGEAGEMGVGVLLPVDLATDYVAGPSGPAVVIRGFGPGADLLAEYLAGQAEAWVEAGRPGVSDLRLTVRQPGAAVGAGSISAATDDEVLVLERPHATIEVGWAG